MSTKNLEKLLKPFIKIATKLDPVASNAALQPMVSSKLGGVPYTEGKDKWPVCTGCEQNLTFVAQLHDPKTNELHVFYYCFDCFPWGIGPNERGQWEIMSYVSASLGRYQAIAVEQLDSVGIKPCLLQGSVVKSLPDWEGLDYYLMLRTAEEKHFYRKSHFHREAASPARNINYYVQGAQSECRAIDNHSPWEPLKNAFENLGCLTVPATLIGGYPYHIQGLMSPCCAICHQNMAFLAQIDSEDEANIMWGDTGLVYLFRCNAHPAQFHFELQCC